MAWVVHSPLMALLDPTPWQRRIWNSALTAIALAAIGYIAFKAGSLVVAALAFLQPLLIPVVIAVILTYLLSPAVNFFCRRGMGRTKAVVLLMVLLLAGFAGILVWVGPPISHQAAEFGRQLPEHTAKGEKLLLSTIEWVRDLQQRFEPQAVAGAERSIRDEAWSLVGRYAVEASDWLKQKLPELLASGGQFLRQSIGGVLGAAGVALSLLLVPVFLFFFLKDSDRFGSEWRNYIPLPESPLKNEIASFVEEINSYLVRYFRGQFIVSLIDGALIGLCLLVFAGLNFALLIGLAVGILGMVPYVGLMVCWVPAVLIAVAQFGDWTHPIIVTVIFLGVSNLESLLIAPRIVGDSVSLRPFTVIVSVLVWSLVLGGLLGALLAVPLTATLKVLMQRYVWRSRA